MTIQRMSPGVTDRRYFVFVRRHFWPIGRDQRTRISCTLDHPSTRIPEAYFRIPRSFQISNISIEKIVTLVFGSEIKEFEASFENFAYGAEND